MGAVHARDLHWEASERSFRRALELDPSNGATYVRFSISTLRPLGKNAEAERLLDIAREYDPLSRDVELEIAMLEFCTGRFEDAIDALERSAPLQGFAPIFLARSLTFADRIPEALAVFDQLGSPADDFPAWYALALVRAGRREEAEALAVAHRGSTHRELFIHAALGDHDRAIAALEREVIEEPQRVPLILTYPELAVLRDDPRVVSIRRKFRLP
jgi:tetratricopeptide (TPR) repeat protein